MNLFIFLLDIRVSENTKSPKYHHENQQGGQASQWKNSISYTTQQKEEKKDYLTKNIIVVEHPSSPT